MWTIGLIVVVIVAIAVIAYWMQARSRDRQPPELRPPEHDLPDQRDATWDPHERYKHGDAEPPAAERPDSDPQ